MNNKELSYKLKYILSELGVNKTEFLELCKKINPTISKPTVLNAINGKNKTIASLDTIATFVHVCQTSNNEKLKLISYDFLLNDNIQEIEANNAQVYQEIGLSDDVINRLKEFNHPFYTDYSSIINYFFIHTPSKYWRMLEMYKLSRDIKVSLDKNDITKALKLINDDYLVSYLERNFKNIYDLYINIKSNKDNPDKNRIDELKSLMPILINHFRYLLIEMNNMFLDNV